MVNNKLLIVGIAVTFIVSFIAGLRIGSERVQIKFDSYKLGIEKKYLEQELQIKQLEKLHKDTEVKYIDKLNDLKDTYEKDISFVTDDYSNRLLQSETRVSLYRKQVRESCNGSEDLANHTAKLDRSLEQGRALVKELRSTLILREDQLRTMGQIIQNDRSKLINKGE